LKQEIKPSKEMQFLDLWNGICQKPLNSKFITKTPTSLEIIEGCLKFKPELGDWESIFNKIINSDFLLGSTKKFKAFNFFNLKNKSLVKKIINDEFGTWEEKEDSAKLKEAKEDREKEKAFRKRIQKKDAHNEELFSKGKIRKFITKHKTNFYLEIPKNLTDEQEKNLSEYGFVNIAELKNNINHIDKTVSGECIYDIHDRWKLESKKSTAHPQESNEPELTYAEKIALRKKKIAEEAKLKLEHVKEA